MTNDVDGDEKLSLIIRVGLAVWASIWAAHIVTAIFLPAGVSNAIYAALAYLAMLEVGALIVIVILARKRFARSPHLGVVFVLVGVFSAMLAAYYWSFAAAAAALLVPALALYFSRPSRREA